MMMFWGIIFLALRVGDWLAVATIGALMAVLGVWSFTKFDGVTGPKRGRSVHRPIGDGERCDSCGSQSSV